MGRPQSHWDWLAVAGLWLGALVLAIKTGELPLMHGAPHFLASPLWGYVPLILFTMSAAIWISRGLLAREAHQIPPGASQAPEEVTQPAIAPSPAPAQIAPEPEPIPQKIRRHVPSGMTPEKLVALYTGHTEVQGRKLTEPFIGLWIGVEGQVRTVWEPMPGYRSVVLDRKTADGAELYDIVRLSFDPDVWAARLDALPIGQAVSVVGEIKKIEPHAVWLKNCELVDA